MTPFSTKSYSECPLFSRSPVDTYLSRGGGPVLPCIMLLKYVSRLLDPLFTPSRLMAAQKDPYFRNFQFLSILSLEITTLWKISILKSQNRGKVSQVFFFFFFFAISVPRTSNCSPPGPFSEPPSWPFGPHIPTKMKIE